MKILKKFSYSTDGYTTQHLNVGDERDDFGSATPGLIEEGYIEIDSNGSDTGRQSRPNNSGKRKG